jgi:hypothetical protein
MLRFSMGKKKKPPYKPPDARRDREQLVKISRQNLQESLEEPGVSNLADLAEASKKVKGKKK